MNRSITFTFAPGVALADAEMSLHLAIFAVEGLVGRDRVHRESGYVVDIDANAILVDGTTDVGRQIAQIFDGLCKREFGETAFRVEGLEAVAAPEGQP